MTYKQLTKISENIRNAKKKIFVRTVSNWNAFVNFKSMCWAFQKIDTNLDPNYYAYTIHIYKFQIKYISTAGV